MVTKFEYEIKVVHHLTLPQGQVKERSQLSRQTVGMKQGAMPMTILGSRDVRKAEKKPNYLGKGVQGSNNLQNTMRSI